MNVNAPRLFIPGIGQGEINVMAGPEFYPKVHGVVRSAVGIKLHNTSVATQLVVEVIADSLDDIIPINVLCKLSAEKKNLINSFIQNGQVDIVYICLDKTRNCLDEPVCRFISGHTPITDHELLALCRMTNVFDEVTFGRVHVDVENKEIKCEQLDILHKYVPLKVDDFGPDRKNIVRCRYKGNSKYLVKGQCYNVTYSTSRHKCKVQKRDNLGMSCNFGIAFSFGSFEREV